MKIRLAADKDIPQVLNLLRQVNLVHRNIRPDLFRVATKYTDEELRTIFAADDTPVFVCEKDDTVLGYLFAVIIDHSGSQMLTPVKEMYVDDLCVDEAARGKGVATALYQYAKEYALKNGCHNLTLNVWEGNDAALAFYHKMGMTPQKTKLETILVP